jgi:hypothetical protein
MKLTPEESVDLTYCTNIHPGNGWSEVLANLRRYAPALKQQFAPDAPFGLGLRLSGAETEQLLQGDGLEHLRAFLRDNNLYVAILNGFPYGSFHRRVIKENVFAPDWRHEERVQYTLRLIRVLTELLPEGLDGGISTLPLSYKGWVGADDRAAWEIITRNLTRVAEALVHLRQAKNQWIHLDIEPEPDGLVETSAELVAFYHDWLLPVGAPLLAGSLQISVAEARQKLLDHIQVCLDTCHVAVEYEEPAAVLARFEQAGIQVGRLQISSALRVNLPEAGPGRSLLAAQIAPFAESSYLHQVIEERDDGTRQHYPDLAVALPQIQQTRARQWRIHFHVPLFVEDYGMFGSTQQEIRTFFRLLDQSAFTRHLEIETYTWEVLPPALKLDLLESIHREYRWVLDELLGANVGPVFTLAA